MAQILATAIVAFALETAFRDCNEIVRAGQQKVRFVWAKIGALDNCLWTFAMTKASAWAKEEDELVVRREPP